MQSFINRNIIHIKIASMTITTIIRNLPIQACDTPHLVATSTSFFAGLALSKFTQVAPQKTIMIVFSDGKWSSTCKTNRSDLRARFACVTRTTKASAIQADSIPITLLWASLDCAYLLKRLWASKVTRITRDCDVLLGEQAQCVCVTNLNS